MQQSVFSGLGGKDTALVKRRVESITSFSKPQKVLLPKCGDTDTRNQIQLFEASSGLKDLKGPMNKLKFKQFAINQTRSKVQTMNINSAPTDFYLRFSCRPPFSHALGRLSFHRSGSKFDEMPSGQGFGTEHQRSESKPRIVKIRN